MFLLVSKIRALAIVFIFLPMLLKLNIYFLLGIILILLLIYIYIDYIIFLEMSKIKNNVNPSNYGFIFGFNIVRVGAETGIWTRGTFPYTAVPRLHDRPLWHLCILILFLRMFDNTICRTWSTPSVAPKSVKKAGHWLMSTGHYLQSPSSKPVREQSTGLFFHSDISAYKFCYFCYLYYNNF